MLSRPGRCCVRRTGPRAAPAGTAARARRRTSSRCRRRRGRRALTSSGPRNTSAIFSPTPMIRPPTIAPATEVKPPRITTGSALSATCESENCTPSLRAPDHAGDQRDEAGHRPDDHPDAVERNADRLRRLVVVGDRAQRAPGRRSSGRTAPGPRPARAATSAATKSSLLTQDAALEDACPGSSPAPWRCRGRSCRCRCPRRSGRSRRGNR